MKLLSGDVTGWYVNISSGNGLVRNKRHWPRSLTPFGFTRLQWIQRVCGQEIHSSVELIETWEAQPVCEILSDRQNFVNNLSIAMQMWWIFHFAFIQILMDSSIRIFAYGTAVMTCGKIGSNMVVKNGVTAKLIFLLNLNCYKKGVSKLGPRPQCVNP